MKDRKAKEVLSRVVLVGSGGVNREEREGERGRIWWILYIHV
jgi:hypothetical protein